MSLKDILVYVNTAKTFESRMRIAADLALAHDAHLCGLYVIPRPSIPLYVEWEIPTEVFDQQEQAAREESERAQRNFTELAQRFGVNAEWRCETGDPRRLLAAHGRYADLIVVSQEDKSVPQFVERGYTDSVAIESGRPVLTVPVAWANRGEFKHILIAWNESREAARAVHDALPLLERAESVSVIVVDQSHKEEEQMSASADLCLHLARHGVTAQAQHVHGAVDSVGEIMLERAAFENADLVVAGAYGHTRVRELILGGVTRYLLDNMTVPVLFSH